MTISETHRHVAWSVTPKKFDYWTDRCQTKWLLLSRNAKNMQHKNTFDLYTGDVQGNNQGCKGFTFDLYTGYVQGYNQGCKGFCSSRFTSVWSPKVLFTVVRSGGGVVVELFAWEANLSNLSLAVSISEICYLLSLYDWKFVKAM